MASATPTRPEGDLDTTVRLVTPERIVFRYPLAGPFRRYVAYLIDLALVVVPYFSRPDLTSMLLMIGLASMLLSRKFQRLGDLAAGTMVVVEERRARVGVARVEGESVARLLAVLPVRIAAGPELARALSD